jgi:hypothetical protein
LNKGDFYEQERGLFRLRCAVREISVDGDDAHLVDLVVQGVRLDPEELSGIPLVAVRFLEDMEDDLPLDSFQDFFQADMVVQAVLMDVKVEEFFGHPAISGFESLRFSEIPGFFGFISYHRPPLSSLPERLNYV